MQYSAKTLNLFIAMEHLSAFMLSPEFFYTSSSKDFHTLLKLVWKSTSCLKRTHIYTMTCCRNDKVYALYHMKIHRVFKKQQSIFFHVLSEYTFKMSCDSPPCYHLDVYFYFKGFLVDFFF